jgi:hypothetical protein
VIKKALALFCLSAVCLLAGVSSLYAQQTGKIIGKITDKETKEPVPFVNVKIFSGGAIKGGGTSDASGFFSSSPLNPGVYNVEVSSVGYSKFILENIKIGAEDIKNINVALTPVSSTTQTVVIEAYKEPIIGINNGERKSIGAEEIAKIPTRNPQDMVATFGAVTSTDYGQGLNVRGNRDGDNAVFINGIRQFGTALPPAESIAELSLITGGVPAQYGDALGGIISVTTKSAAKKFSFGVQGETSSLFDQWHYNFAGINASGPIWTKKETIEGSSEVQERTIVGFFGALQYTYNADNRPAALPIYRASDKTMESLRSKPLTRFSNSYTPSANLLRMTDFEEIKARPNFADNAIQANLNIDIQPKEDILITVGGNFNRFSTRTGPSEDNGDEPEPSSFQNLFNFDNNGRRIDQNFNAFVRMRQTFNSGIGDTGSLLKNVYYQLQADYVNQNVTNFDPRFMDRVNEYNHVGKFDITTINSRIPWQSPFAPTFTEAFNNNGTVEYRDRVFRSTPDKVYELQNIPNGLTFTPGQYNPDLALINKQLFAENAIPSDARLLELGGMLNGAGGGGINDFGYFYPAIGKAMSGYGMTNQQQFRFSAMAAAEIKHHNLKIGFELEQRIISSYSTGSLYGRGRQQLNTQFSQLGNEIKVDDLGVIQDANDPNFGDTLVKVTLLPFINPGTLPDGRSPGQSVFDFNFRRNNNIAPNQIINLDAYDPNSFGIRDFSVTDILDNGFQPLAAWQGYNAYGKRAARSSFFDFFTDTLNRPIDAFRPLYYAGFIEDKFIVGDLILSLGLRVDAFDVNMPVLKDKYTFTKLTTASEFYRNAGRTKPNSVGDDWSVYVDKPAADFNGSNYGEFEVVGYRNGDVWYDQNGFETSNPQTLERNGTVNPFFNPTAILDPNLKTLQKTTGITLDAYEDFKPQVNFMPRISFSFPLNENALFYAHYDVMTQRPLGIDANGSIQQNYASPDDYYRLLIRNGGFINNPNLRPQKKIDYALGFQQALNQKSAIKFSAFYSEIKDLIQVINVNYAYPIRYTTSGNQDFSVVKGLTLEYDLRRSENFTASASYTLSFAEGSASNFAGALLNTSTPNLRNTTPLSYDQRHAIKLNFDYRLNDKQGPELFGVYPLENVGFNATFYTASGTPYTQDGSVWGGRYQVRGSINGARLPWNNRTSIRVDKTFTLKQEGKRAHNINLYLYVQNLFNAENVLSVYSRTGSARDDGYLASTFGQNNVKRAVDPEAYAMFYNLAILDPERISLPRRFRIGVSYNF